MNLKIIGGLLVLVLVVQATSMVNISKKIGGLNDQQISILSSVNQIAGVGGSGFLEPDDSTGGYTLSFTNFYLYGRCTITTYTYDDATNLQIGGPVTISGTTNGDSCNIAGLANTNQNNEIDANFVLLKDGGINIMNSKDVVKTQFRINKIRQ